MARGALLIGWVALCVGVPALVAHRLVMHDVAARYALERDAFVSAALATVLERDPAADERHDAWLKRIEELSNRVRWAALLDPDGKGLEFRRRTAMAHDEIVAQVDLHATRPQTRPLKIDGLVSHRFELITLPLPDAAGTVAVVFDRGDTPRSTTALYVVLLAAASFAGLLGAIVGFRVGIQRPIERMGRSIGDLRAGLAELGQTPAIPVELTPIVQSVGEMAEELRQWRSEATSLRHTVDMRVDQRMREADRGQRLAERAADTDALTRLGNRRALERDLPALAEAARRTKMELTAVMIDVDRFKMVNDVLGHAAGDELLQFLADLLRTAIRHGTDRAIRCGGDEFLLLLPGTSPADAAIVAHRLAALFQQRARTLERIRPLPGLSIGIAGLREDAGGDPGRLLKRADAAMYWAKRHGQPFVLAGESARTAQDDQTATAPQPR